MSALEDGGPAFPCAEDHKVAADLLWTQGMSKRDLFAAILMHSEAVTCGVPGEAADALVEASREAGTDVIDHMASNAVAGAEALLRALAAPAERKPEPIPAHLMYDGWTTSATQHSAIKRIAKQPDFDELPEFLRTFVTLALERIKEAEDGIPF